LPSGGSTIDPGLVRDLARDMLVARRLRSLTLPLLELHEKRPATDFESPPRIPQFMAAVIDFYDAWNRVEPGHGHEVAAARWRAELTRVHGPGRPPSYR
jgi:hypothetical protein